MKRLLCALLAALLLCGCTAVPNETTEPAAPVLKAGFYTYDREENGGIPLYFQLFEDGTGYLAMLAVEAPLTWTPEGTIRGIANGELEFIPTDDGMLWDGEKFAFTGDSLPEGFIPNPPEPGVYAVSSVSRNGDLDFYGSFTRSNGYFELKEDGTGLLVFDDAEYPFTMEGNVALFDSWKAMLLDQGSEEPGAAPLVMIYVMDGPIQADSIAFRKLEE